MEIERKYLADPSGLSLSSYPKKELSQGYISTDPVIRIRRSDESYILTVKSDGLIARQEYEIPLSAEQYERLSDKVEGICISKTRYLIPWEEGRLTIELDLFHGALTGLVYAEVEFPTLEAAEAFTPPSWFLREVTEDGAFTNAAISRLAPSEIPAFLKKAACGPDNPN